MSRNCGLNLQVPTFIYQISLTQRTQMLLYSGMNHSKDQYDLLNTRRNEVSVTTFTIPQFAE